MRVLVLIPLLAGCSLPSWPVQTIRDLPPTTFTGDGCRVRVEGIGFDPDVRLAARPETQWLASLTPTQQQSYAADKADFAQRYLATITANERDYVGKKGSVVVGTSGSEPFVVRSRVLAFDPQSGHLEAAHAVFRTSDEQQVGEFTASSTIGSWYGSGMRMRIASVAQGVTVLKYFADRFQCAR